MPLYNKAFSFNREEWLKALDECKPVPYQPDTCIPKVNRLQEIFKTNFPPIQQTKKEEKVSSSINLVMSAEKFAAFLLDLQELAPSTKTKYDKNGNTTYNPETGDYETVEVPVDERWVTLKKVRVNADGKFVAVVELSTLNSMDQLNARRERIKSYEA